MIVESTLNQIHKNLALEKAIVARLLTHGSEEPVLYLWRNRDCVVFGRNQNPYSEVNLGAVRSDAVDLCRRRTGGGCVFQDLNNSVYTFAFPNQTRLQPEVGNALLIEAVAAVTGGKAQLRASGRNDLLLGDAKVSGNAYKLEHGSYLHHGTLLRASDLSRLSHYITPHPIKFADKKGCESVRSRVTTLKEALGQDVSHEAFCEALKDAFRKRFGSAQQEERVDSIHAHPLLESSHYRTELAELADPLWTYGATLPYSVEHSLRVPGLGVVELRFKLVRDAVIDVQLFTDAFDTTLLAPILAAVKAKFIGVSGTRLSGAVAAEMEECVVSAFRRAEKKFHD